jgi:hypothetical protein
MRATFVVPLAALVGSLAVPAQGQPLPAAQSHAPAMASRIRLPAAFANIHTQQVTVQGRQVTKGELLSHFDPAERHVLPSGATITTQDLMDRMGRAEDRMHAGHTSMTALPQRKVVSLNAATLAFAQHQKLQQSVQRFGALKNAGWVSGWVEHPVSGSNGSASSTQPLARQLSPSLSHSALHNVGRMVDVCDFSSGRSVPSCSPDFSAIDAPPWSQDMGDPSSVGATSSFSLHGSTSNGGDSSTCSVEWNNVGQVFGTSWDMLRVSASETADARAQSFSGSLAVYVAGTAMTVGPATDDGSDGYLMNDTYGVSAGGQIPLAGPIYLNLSFSANATIQMALVGERRMAQGDPTAPLGRGSHCHVGVQPSLDTDVTVTAGVGIGIDDVIDLLHFNLNGDTHPITATLPAHVTLDLLRTPPQGEIAFDAHLNATFMKSRLWVDWQLFDVCVSYYVGTTCLLRDVLQIPTSGTITIVDDAGWPGVDQDLAGGRRAIRWHPDPFGAPLTRHRVQR